MKVRCRTNLDDYHMEQWPEEVCCRPMVGDRVQAKSGRSLCICTITHSRYRLHEYDPDTNTIWLPMLIIELHKRGS